MAESTGTLVAHDPFARGGYRRHSEGSGECLWCGQRRERVYSYEWESDDSPRVARGTETFCNMDCFRSFHF